MAHDKELDALFALPLEEFTPARNALAARLKKAGQRQEAERVKALPKPSVTAWAVNQLFWNHRNELFELIATGERVLMAQTSQLSGKSVDMREALEARRESLSRLLRLAATVLSEGGHNASPDKMRRLSDTLEAISTRPDTKPDGRLTDDIDAPGFELFAALMPSGPQVKPKPLPTPPATQRARKAEDSSAREIEAAMSAVENAERVLTEVRTKARDANFALQDAVRKAREAEQVKREADKHFEAARARVSALETESEKAAKALKDAESAVEHASRHLRSIKT